MSKQNSSNHFLLIESDDDGDGIELLVNNNSVYMAFRLYVNVM